MINQEKELIQKYGFPPQNFPISRHRTHGLSQNMSLAQFFAFLLIICEMLVYCLCIHKLFQSISILIVYFTFGLIGIISAGLAIFHNPTDWIVYYYKNSDKNKEIHFKYSYKDLRFCNFCDSYCFKSSKHCRQCNRCVQNFDHHCIWFNNCVGKGNYTYFLVSIFSLFLHMSLYIAHLIVATIYEVTNNLILQNLGIFITAWIIGVIIFAFDILILNLLGLHFYLICQGITSYEFLSRDNKNQLKHSPSNASKNKILNTPLNTQTKINQDVSSLTKKQNIHFQKVFSQQKIKNEYFYCSKKENKAQKPNEIYQQDQTQNQTSFTKLNSQIIVVKQKKAQDTILKQNEKTSQNYLKLNKILVKITQKGESTRVFINNQGKSQQLQYCSQILNTKKIQKNSKKGKRQIHNQGTRDKIQQQNPNFQYLIHINQQDKKSCQSDVKTIKSIQLKQKKRQNQIQPDLDHYQINDEIQMNDQIISGHIEGHKSIQSCKGDVQRKKTFKKQPRMKTYVAYTRNQNETYWGDQKKQKSQASPSQNRLHRLQDYLRNNSSLKLILNSDQQETYSPIRLPDRKKKEKLTGKINQNETGIQKQQGQFYFNQIQPEKLPQN